MLPMPIAIVTIPIERFAALSQGRDSWHGYGARLAKCHPTILDRRLTCPATTTIANLVAALLDENPYNLQSRIVAMSFCEPRSW